MDWDGSGTDSVEIKITFSVPVFNVSYDLFDIDERDETLDSPGPFATGPFRDEVTNFAAQHGATTGLTPTLTANGANPSFDFSGAPSDTATGDRSNNGGPNDPSNNADGSIDVSWGASVALDQITFDYQSNPRTGVSETNSVPQLIGLGNITFTPVPEVGTNISLAALALGAIFLAHRRKGSS